VTLQVRLLLTRLRPLVAMGFWAAVDLVALGAGFLVALAAVDLVAQAAVERALTLRLNIN
jgi:hypothetical protein